MQVWVDPPRIEGDTVHFSWRQSLPNPYQESNAFFYRYEGIDLTNYSVDCFYEIFLAMQTRVFAAYDEPVTVIFPTPVSGQSAAFWCAYHETTSIDVTPLAEEGSYNPWADEQVLVEGPRKVAVLFGGGKDSSLATCLLSEIYGPDEVVLFQFVGPLRNKPEVADKLEARQRDMMLTPMQTKLGVAIQRGWTNYQAIFLEAGYPYRPHLEFYTAGALPMMLAWNIELITFTAPWTIISAEPRRNGGTNYRYRRSRPEAMAAQSIHYAATLGAPIQVTNAMMPFHSLLAHWLLAERYPWALDSIVPCTQAPNGTRWCYRCLKCNLFALSSLSTATAAADFDYERWLTKSPFINTVIAQAESGVGLTMEGNAPWILKISTGIRSVIQQYHTIARIRIDELDVKLSHEARGNLTLLKAMYGNTLFPEWEMVSGPVLTLLGPGFGEAITRIAQEHFEVLDGYPGPNYAAKEQIGYDFEPLPLPSTLLPHIVAYRERNGDVVSYPNSGRNA